MLDIKVTKWKNLVQDTPDLTAPEASKVDLDKLTATDYACTAKGKDQPAGLKALGLNGDLSGTTPMDITVLVPQPYGRPDDEINIKGDISNFACALIFVHGTTMVPGVAAAAGIPKEVPDVKAVAK